MQATDGRKASIRVDPRLWHIVAMMLASVVFYYSYLIAGLAGWGSLRAGLYRMHDFYGLDFYALVFFAPVVYAAYIFSMREVLLTALISMMLILPEAMLSTAYPSAFLRPTAFGIILSAVGATIALLQRSDEQRHQLIKELGRLYNISKAADESNSTEAFLSSVVGIICRDAPHPRKTEIRIRVRDKEFQSSGFREASGNVKEDIIIGGQAQGAIEMHYFPRHLRLDKQYLITRAIAERISEAVRRIELEQSLKHYSEQLESMVESRTRDLKQAEAQLRLLSNTVKSSFDGITLADLAGNVTFANEASQRMWGYSLDEFVRLPIKGLYSPEDSTLIEQDVIPQSRANLWSGELTAIRKDGQCFPTLITTSPVRDEKGDTVAIVGVHRDITETRAMQDKLIRSERLAAVGELASSVGHELRNPFNVIKNCVYLLGMKLGADMEKDIASTLKLLDRQVDISNRIISDLLDFTRVRKPTLARVDLNNLLKETLNTVEVRKNVTVLTSFAGSSPQVRADAEQVGRSFVNLITNAIQSIDSKGEVTVASNLDTDYAVVSFADTGCGIPPENLEKLFEPLFTTKPKGTGLGLAISRRLIEQNGGAIAVASEVGKGTTFTVRLPLYR